MSTSWTKKDEKYIKDNYGKMSIPEMAQNLGRSYDSVESKIKRMRIRGTTPPTVTQTAPFHRQSTSDLPRMISTRIKQKNTYNEIVIALNEIRKTFVPMKIETITKKGKFYDETEVLLISDLHIGRRVVVGDEITYDKNIAKRRFKAITAGIRHLNTTYVLQKHRVEELVIVLLGDLVDGELIYEGQQYEQDLPILDQLLFATRLLKSELIDPASQMFKKVRIVAVPGNHGEIRNERGIHMMHPRSNFDNIVAVMLQIACQDLKNVTFEIAMASMHMIKIRGWKFLISHKLPHPQMPSGRNKYGGYFERFKFDAVLRAHFHVPDMAFYNTKPIIMNGSLPGTDDYAYELSFNSDPRQVMFTVSDNRPMALFWLVDVGKIEKELEELE